MDEDLKQQELNSLEIDAIGEILNISMGAAATAVSSMLNKKVDITTPVVSFIRMRDFECSSLEPAVGIEIEYVKGLSGSNILVMKRRDLRIIVGLLLGEESDPDSTEELDEMHLSAASEIMNQMMGSSSTALATFFGQSVSISTPRQFDASKVKEKIPHQDDDAYIVTVRFLLTIEGILNSEFVTVMPVEFTKKLVENAMHLNDEPQKAEKTPPAAADALAPAQQPAPEPAAKEPEPKPAPEPKPVPEPKLEPQLKPVPELKPAPEPPAAAAPARRTAQQPASPRQVNVKPLKLPSFDEESRLPSSAEAQGNFGMIMGVPLEVTVEIGKTRLSVKDVLDIRQGSLIELDKQAGDPVDVIINGQLIAKGDVVIIDDDFGVRITEIISEKEAAAN